MGADTKPHDPSLDVDRFADVPDPVTETAAHPDPAAAMAAPAELSLTRAQRRRLLIVGVGITLAAVLFLTARAGIRSDLTAHDVWIPFALWLLMGGAALGIAFRRRPRGLAPSVERVRFVGAAVPALFAIIALGWSDASLTWGDPWTCLELSATLSATPMGIAALLLQRTFLSAPASRGAVAGALCGLLGATSIHAHCAFAGTGHILLSHGLPILGGAAIGAALGALRGRV